MKAEYEEMKGFFGEIRLFPENLDDLWHCAHLVRPGDLVFATTFRSVESASDKLRPEKAEKKPFRLGVRIERVEFQPAVHRLRLHGVIEHGVDTGSYHTLNIEASHELSVIKQWTSMDRERLERAVKASTAALIHVLAIEDGEAQLFRIRQYGPEEVLTVQAGSGKREGQDARPAFFEAALAPLRDLSGPVVIAGPGFVKDDFLAYVRSQAPDVAERCLAADTRSAGRGAVSEAIGQGIIGRITEDIQLAREVKLMEELLSRIGRGSPVAYGRDEVARAVEYGAAETVLVTDSMMREPAVTELCEAAEQRRANVVVLSTSFDPGEQLDALGGIAALLRYAVA
ncbi:MAG: mRNA surveillance protein pelota [Methanomicrobiales archaeon]|nr:mRNA surveillance protein pelota [Methanomicrobiales archaeon]